MINIIDYGFVPSMLTESSNLIPARITAVHKERYDIICEYGQTFARLKSSIYFCDGNENFPTAGDFVLIQYNNSGDSIIFKTLERKSFFSRLDPSSSGHAQQAVAANFDYVFITSSLNNDFNLKRIERYLTLAWQSGAVPVIVLTKVDLTDTSEDKIHEVEKLAAGVGVYAVSSKTGKGLELLSEYLKPRKTIVLLGSSGVGKSSLVNALAGEEIMKVNDIREDDSKGRHTTTHRQLIMMKNGVMIIDTPGMRELGMWDVSSGLGQSFSDIGAFIGKCKFSDCKHQSEPGCAIKEAIDNGLITRERWNSYLQLKKEAKYTDDKAVFLREKQQWHKNIMKMKKQLDKWH